MQNANNTQKPTEKAQTPAVSEKIVTVQAEEVPAKRDFATVVDRVKNLSGMIANRDAFKIKLENVEKFRREAEAEQISCTVLISPHNFIELMSKDDILEFLDKQIVKGRLHLAKLEAEILEIKF
ncbi:hypothetical protein [Siphonobacter sp. SORGH_AS_0500]|uniref:hypothetical protein n=1 Tax=Siphonobacter sp. SORGH_AS_0500 TaxID=1864824 RepID=UPI0028635EC1|nr:hypothetical protein [Siphonobacter sp. SORGH_AS_0500]MDR6196153.1 hypothetical protein [Siphonobacter sp. SORGH_AS_0500]